MPVKVYPASWVRTVIAALHVRCLVRSRLAFAFCPLRAAFLAFFSSGWQEAVAVVDASA